MKFIFIGKALLAYSFAYLILSGPVYSMVDSKYKIIWSNDKMTILDATNEKIIKGNRRNIARLLNKSKFEDALIRDLKIEPRVF